MKISELLFEYNEKRLINGFGNKLQIKSKSDSSAPKNLSSDNLIKNISDLDPTGNKELTFWLVLNYANNRINRYEDIASRAIPELLKYKALLKKPNLTPPLTIRDINQIKGLTSLEEIVDQYQEKETTSNKEQENKEEQNFFNTGQAELIYNDSQVKVIVPKTKEASCFFGINTKWCTAAKSSNNMFDEYNTDGPLYIVLFKKENKRFQFHFQSEQFMNEKDEYVNPNELADEYPILWKIFSPIAEKNNSLYLNEHPSEKVQLAAVRKNGYAIRYIKNPSEQLQLAAVRKNGYAIRYIKNPSEKVQLAAVQQDVEALEYIKNPSEKFQLAAVQQAAAAIRYIKNPSEQVQLATVQQNGYAIQFIENPSLKVNALQKKLYRI